MQTRPPDPPAGSPSPDPATYDAADVGRLLACSVRHVRRLHDARLMPPAVRLGRLVRWRRADIDAWLTGGCRPCR
jgi:excisionase family DNA binding protein